MESVKELSPIDFCKLSKRDDVFEIRIRQLFIAPKPPVHYARVISAGPFDSLLTYLMFDGGRECWREVGDPEDDIRELFE